MGLAFDFKLIPTPSRLLLDERSDGGLSAAPRARNRKARRCDPDTEGRRDGGAKVEGRKNHAELRPQVVAEAKRLRRKRPKGGQRSYRQIATELFHGGYCNSNGRPFSPSSIKAML